jgi:hypothetical protein
METKSLLEFTSHIDGKNAIVQIFADRVEYTKPGRVTLTRLAGGAATMGASLMATGIRTGGEAEMIPIKNITSVNTGKDGLRYHKVVITASNATIEFRVDKAVADAAKVLLSQLMLGTHPAQLTTSSPQVVITASPTPAPATPAAGGEGKVEQLKSLKELLDSGILTQEEFDAEKQKILGN